MTIRSTTAYEAECFFCKHTRPVPTEDYPPEWVRIAAVTQANWLQGHNATEVVACSVCAFSKLGFTPP